MKNRTILFFIFLFAAVFAGGALLQVAASQQDYNIQEKELVQRYKLANVDYEEAKAAYMAGDLSKAEKLLAKCLRRMPEHGEAHFLKAQILYKKGELEKALESQNLAEENFGLVVKILVKQQQDRLFELEKRKDEVEAAVTQLREQLSRATSDQQRMDVEDKINNLEAHKATIQDRLREPLPIIDKMPAEYPYFHGNIFFMLKNYPEAEKQYLAALQIDSRHLKATNNLVNLYYMARRYEEALECIRRAENLGLAVNDKLKMAVLTALGR